MDFMARHMICRGSLIYLPPASGYTSRVIQGASFFGRLIMCTSSAILPFRAQKGGTAPLPFANNAASTGYLQHKAIVCTGGFDGGKAMGNADDRGGLPELRTGYTQDQRRRR
ncbi:hypothetical protein LguiA_026996 [Lonicera macranthoides]